MRGTHSDSARGAVGGADSAVRATLSAQERVKPGDTIAITRSSGAKLKGQVLEPTDCSLVIQRPGKTLAVPDAAIKND